MTGKGHLIFGGIAGVALFKIFDIPVTLESVGLATAVVAVSSLAADLDAPGGKLAKNLSLKLSSNALKGILVAIVLLILAGAYYFAGMNIAVAGAVGLGTLVLSHGMRENTPRKIVLALLGIGIALYGINKDMYFLVALGMFVAVAPWTPHRTITHTVWAVALWYYICSGFEGLTGIEGVTWLGTGTYISHLVADSLTKARVKWLWPVLNRPLGIPLLRVGSDGLEMGINAAFALLVAVFVFATPMI